MFDSDAVVDRVKERAEQISSILNEMPEHWWTRTSIARKMGRSRLGEIDLSALTLLETTGRIKVDRVPDRRPVGVVFYYSVDGKR